MALNQGSPWQLWREFQDPQALADWEQNGLMLQAPVPSTALTRDGDSPYSPGGPLDQLLAP